MNVEKEEVEKAKATLCHCRCVFTHLNALKERLHDADGTASRRGVIVDNQQRKTRVLLSWFAYPWDKQTDTQKLKEKKEGFFFLCFHYLILK